jgi:hypothetical protein
VINACHQLLTRLRTACPTIHAIRVWALLTAVETAIHHQRLTLTELGRGLRSPTLVKHNIKRMDRLLGNSRLGTERLPIFQAVAHWLLAGRSQPIVLVDWSDLTADRAWQLLRASIPVRGRAVTIYEEVHPLCAFASRHVHRRFLQHVAQVLPREAQPIVVTDAGFRGTWFQLVESFGWHWIGRIRNRTLVQQPGAQPWHPCKDLYAQATAQPSALGVMRLVRSNPVACPLYLVRQRPKGRKKTSVFGHSVGSSHSRKHAAREREPWLLGASLGWQHLGAKRIVALYRQRMQIEEAFRDLKSERYGLGFTASHTRGALRLANLLLIGALALLVLWWVGQATQQQHRAYHYQANTRKHRPVLSLIFLGRQVMRRAAGGITPHHLRQAIRSLQHQLAQMHAA